MKCIMIIRAIITFCVHLHSILGWLRSMWFVYESIPYVSQWCSFLYRLHSFFRPLSRSVCNGCAVFSAVEFAMVHVMPFLRFISWCSVKSTLLLRQFYIIIPWLAVFLAVFLSLFQRIFWEPSCFLYFFLWCLPSIYIVVEPLRFQFE